MVDGARRHLRVLAAEPRPAGSAAESAARRYCQRVLEELGFSVTEEPFEYSSAPGRLATPIAGVSLIAIFAAAGHLGFHHAPGAALALLLGGGGVLALGARWAARRAVLGLRWRRARSINLVAARGVPRVWLVAHLDSKSQPVPILVRALGILGSIVLWCAAVANAAAQIAGAEVAWMWPWMSVAGSAAALPVAASVVRARSPGALDNASGVATVLLAAHALPPDLPVGVLLTSAEELGLAGARAWARGRTVGWAINCDGVDDRGALRYIFSGRRPAHLLGALANAARRAGEPASARRLLPGVLLDAVALHDAGWDAVTISKGTVRTVARIHTSADRISAFEGRGIASAAAVIADAVVELS